jgi:16S rRNA (guanine1516-N2)-methyltransferase
LSDLSTTEIRVCVTTPRKTTREQIRLSSDIAAWCGCRYAARRDRALERMFHDEEVDVIVVADDPAKVHHRLGAQPLFFHPSMAAQRFIRQARGEQDRLLVAAGVKAGDTVVDATLGLASDALILAHAVGSAGRVVGLESSIVTATMLRVVQHFGSHQYAMAANLLRQVEIRAVSHEDWLSEQPDGSVDVIYFDPMFRSPNEDSSSLAPLRSFADTSPLSERAISEAKRVARRTVVIKERPSLDLFRGHGFVPDHPRRKVAYGVWHKHHG